MVIVRNIAHLKKKEANKRYRLSHVEVDIKLIEKTKELIKQGKQMTITQMKGGNE